MAHDTQRFWPSLYDRLREGEVAGIDDYFVDANTLRDMVKRDLELLLNATALEASDNLDNYPAIKRSVLNFGLPGLTGKVVSGMSPWEVQERLRVALANYEPRIVPDTLRVRVSTAEGEDAEGRYLDPERGVNLVISGTILGMPMAEEVYIRTRWDVELGEAEVSVE